MKPPSPVADSVFAALLNAGPSLPKRPAIMIAMPTAEIYTLLLAGLLIGGVLWVVTRFIDRD